MYVLLIIEEYWIILFDSMLLNYLRNFEKIK